MYVEKYENYEIKEEDLKFLTVSTIPGLVVKVCLNFHFFPISQNDGL